MFNFFIFLGLDHFQGVHRRYHQEAERRQKRSESLERQQI